MWTWLQRSMRGLLWVALFASNKEKPCLRYIRAQTLCGRARAFTNATNVCK